jgi:DNA-binding transcriptional ArsR family regulator
MTQMSKRARPKSKRASCCPGIDKLFEARFFKALCDPCRIGILTKLARSCEPRTVSDIAGCCPPDLSVVSRHLATLRDAGILEAEKRGKEVYYSVRYAELAVTLRGMADAIEACCPND